ncbi:MAG: ABC transporter ATP-binding protein [Acidimicrobiales bacterium]
MTGAAAEPVLEVTDLCVDLPTTAGVVHAVRGMSFTLQPGRVLGIVGESGSGKSMTALAVMGLLPAGARVTGSVRLCGQELIGLGEREYRAVRGRRVAMVFQDPMTSLNPTYTAGWQVAEAVRAHQAVSRGQAFERAVELLDAVGIADASKVARSHPHQLSGGMRQRVVIAMAMANEPQVILADEPTTALDVTVQSQVLETLERLRRTTSAAMVLITHDLGVMAGTADDVLVMYAGKPAEVGPVDEVFYRPAMPYTVGLLGSLPRMGGDRPGALTPIAGAPPSLVGTLADGCLFAPRCSWVRPECDCVEPALDPVDADSGADAGPPGHRVACHASSELVAGR